MQTVTPLKPSATPRKILTLRRYLIHIAWALFFTYGLWIQPRMRNSDATKMQDLARNGVRVTGQINSISHAQEMGEYDNHMWIVSYGYHAHPRGDMNASLTPYNREEIATEDEIAQLRAGGPIDVVYPLMKPAEARPTFVLRHKIPNGNWGPWLSPLPLLIVLMEGLFRLGTTGIARSRAR
jgi:hypothetical protein